MMSFNTLVQSVQNSFVNAGRTRARLELLARGDSFLADTGFSRELLERGNDAWPWRVDGQVPTSTSSYAVPPAGLRTPAPALHNTAARRIAQENAKSVAELRALSDAELSDLGISRAGIVEAVRHGRPGIDPVAVEPGHRKAA